VLSVLTIICIIVTHNRMQNIYIYKKNILLVCGCSKFLPIMSLFTVSMKVLLNMLHVLLGLETISFPSCSCILLVSVLFGEPLSLFTNFHSTFGVLFDLVTIF
jgi:hypothetical protein